jgi:hypothetical protein
MQKFILSTRKDIISLFPFFLILEESKRLGEDLSAESALIIEVSSPHIFLMLLKIFILNHILILHGLHVDLVSRLTEALLVIKKGFVVLGEDSRLANVIVGAVPEKHHLSHLKLSI